MTVLDAMSFDKQTIVERANAVRTELTGDFDQVRHLMDANELVVAVWSDAQERDGVGTKIVKGRRVLESIISSGRSQALSWTAVPCTCLEQAIALQQLIGHPDLH